MKGFLLICFLFLIPIYKSFNNSQTLYNNFKNKNILCLKSKEMNSYFLPVFEEMSESARFFFRMNFSDLDLEKGAINEFYLNEIGKGQIVLLIGIALFIIGILGFFICCCQAFCIRKLQIFYRCCRMDINHETRSKKERCCLIAGPVFLGLIILGISFLLLINDDIGRGYIDAKCNLEELGMQLFQTDNVTTDTDIKWQGTIPYSVKLTSAYKTFQNLSNNQELKELKNFNVLNLLNYYHSILNNEIPQLELYDNQTLINPNPLSNKVELESAFFENWGPGTHSGTNLYNISQELKLREVYIENMNSLITFSNKLFNEHIEYSNIYSINNEKLTNFGLNLGSNILQITDFMDSNQEYFNNFNQITKIFLCLNVFSCLIAILGICLISIGKIRCCNFCVHLSWIFSLLLFLLLIITTFFCFVVGSMSVYGCDLLDTIGSSPKNLIQNLRDLNWETETISTLEFCLFNSEKDLSKYYNFKNSLELPTSMSNILNILREMSLPYAGIKSLEEKLDFLQNYYENVAGEATTPDNPINTMIRLNMWSNSETVGSLQETQAKCDVSKDQYVFRNGDCVYKTQYNMGDNEKVGLGGKICISLEKTSRDFAIKRYSDDVFQACQTQGLEFASVYEAIQKYYKGLYEYKDNTEKILDGIQIHLTALETKENELDRQIKNMFANMDERARNLDPLLKLMSSMYGQMNCSFIKNKVLNSKRELCVTSMNGIFYLFISIFSLMLIQGLLAFCTCLASIRLVHSPEEDVERTVLIDRQTDIETRRNSILY